MKENVPYRDETRRSLKNHPGNKRIQSQYIDYNFLLTMFLIVTAIILSYQSRRHHLSD